MFVHAYPVAIRIEWTLIDRPYTLLGKAGWRDLAYAEPEKHLVTFHRKILDRDVANIIALMRHEIAHCVDPHVFTRPGREQRADDIAEQVTGQRIYYDDRDVQTLDVRGKYPRPLYLHR